MKAYVLKAIGDLQYIDVDLPYLKSGWALIKVRAAGICSSDIPRVFSKGTYHFPTIPGHEFSGVVDQVSDQKEKNWIGKPVGIFPLIPCKQCKACKSHKYEVCEHYDYIGSRRDGGFAEYVAVPTWNLIQLPAGFSYEEAAMLEPTAVALHAINHAGITKGDHVAIIGSGAIGFIAAQWARIKGAGIVTVFGRTEEKEKLANHIGIKYSITGCVAERFDRVIEAVGTHETIEYAIRICNSGGKVVLMGNPSSDIFLEQNIYWQILRKQLTFVGTWNSSYESGGRSEWTEALGAIESKRINLHDLITQRFSQDKLIEGLQLMKNHTTSYCKVMTIWNGD